ncbi:GNAT family N-acetyltransferase [Phycicoccus sp. MQZ13P-5]|uniref:GNAT family N-acetyltransferase n=1 Tax=Phycicoccus sonneratiae TaxID=2807628 RepID=A0ABS2CHH9_9MICO|nr:GNAT family N-acetyltransferase [Phycicoccus sonneraticus]
MLRRDRDRGRTSGADRTPGGADEAPSPFAAKPTLVGDLVTLRPVTAEDADVLDRVVREDDEIAVLTGSVHDSTAPLPATDPQRLREIYGAWAVADDRLVLAVLDNVDGSVVGEVVLNDWDSGNRSCGFRTFVGAAGRGRGLGTEATRLVVEHGLGSMGLHRIRLEVYDTNPRARHVYEKVGFVHEGTGREALLLDGRWVDVHFMAVLADPAVSP